MSHAISRISSLIRQKKKAHFANTDTICHAIQSLEPYLEQGKHRSQRSARRPSASRFCTRFATFAARDPDYGGHRHQAREAIWQQGQWIWLRTAQRPAPEHHPSRWYTGKHTRTRERHAGSSIPFLPLREDRAIFMSKSPSRFCWP